MLRSKEMVTGGPRRSRIVVGTRGWLVAAWAVGLSMASVVASPGDAAAETERAGDGTVLGFQVRAGGRFDNVRMCVASPAGTPGGPAADVSFFAEFGLTPTISLSLNVPVFRPVLFGAAFRMLQFEPEVTLGFRVRLRGRLDLIVGPSLGLSLHYGPDYRSERDLEHRNASFFAVGPSVGAYLGLDFERPGRLFNFQLGFRPYVTPLFPVGSSTVDVGVVAGGTLDLVFRFSPGDPR